MLRRLIDLLVASVCLVITAPLQLVIALLIKRDSGGPIFYIPKMVGQHRTIFPLLRFRTMRSEEGQEASAEMRLTPVGRTLQHYSLDHLPMLWNLLLSHLTLVGPRPMEIEAVDSRDLVWQAYCSVKPGLFNHAVLTLGNQWTPRRREAPGLNQTLELEYLQRRSWREDIALVIKWLHALVVSKGNVKMRKPPDAEW